MLVVFGAGVPSKPLLMARRRISCVTCYITFKTRFSFMEHVESSVCPLAPVPVGAEGRFGGDFMVVLDRSGVGDLDITFVCKYCI